MRETVNMHDNLAAVVKSVLALKDRPSAALILGDCAYLDGKEADYALLVKLLEPLRTASLPIHLLLGNHDHRERFWKALPEDAARDKDIDGKHVMTVKAERANFFLLDSLDITNKAPGALGKDQLDWLGLELDANDDKPAIVCVHHNPDLRPMPGGLTDTQPLYDVILPRKQVKALFFGHTHVWNQEVKEGVHLINLPPVAYCFTKGKPSGFIELALEEGGAKMTLSSLDEKHAEHGKTTELKWRT
jgi:3',5'-cyclic AMP phosphodiesterase CpdA